MKEVIILGCGGHAKSVIDIILSNNDWKIKGLIGKKEELNKSVLNYKVIGTDDDLEEISHYISELILGIGQIGTSRKRQEIVKDIEKYNFNFPSIKSKYSIVSLNSSIGEGTTVGHGAIINADSNIGSHCIINSSALIEHDVEINNFCHISTGAVINGNVIIGEGSFIGSGAIIREGLKIPRNSVISAGKVVMGWPFNNG